MNSAASQVQSSKPRAMRRGAGSRAVFRLTKPIYSEMNNSPTPIPPSSDEAVRLLKRAAELDPHLIRPWSSLAFAYNLLSYSGADFDKLHQLPAEETVSMNLPRVKLRSRELTALKAHSP